MATDSPKEGGNLYGEDVRALQVRMPDDLHEQVRQAAEREGVSMNKWACDALEQKVAGRLRSTDPAKRLDRLEQDLRDVKTRLSELEEEL